MKRALSVLASAAILWSAVSIRLHAVDLRNVLTDYTLTSWSRKDGLSGPVWAVAQDADGFLWLGNDEGVVRFDGVRFVPWDRLGAAPLPRLTVRSLHVSGDRSLWVGFGATGGVARIQGKAARIYGEADGAGTGAVTAMAEDRGHTLWVAGANGVFRFENDRWQRLGAPQGLPEGAATNVYVDSSDTVWVGTGAGLYWRPRATEDAFQQIDPPSDPVRVLSISEDSTGRMWTTDPLVGFRTLAFRTIPVSGAEVGRGYRLLHDRRGNLWVGTIGQGLWRVTHLTNPERESVEKTTVLSGLSSDAVRSVFEDRDGNIWAGTTEGVDRLVPHRIVPWTGLGLVGTVAAAENRIWAGTAEGILRFSRTASAWQLDPNSTPVRGVRSLRVDGDGVVWTISSDGLLRVDATGTRRVALPADVNGSNIEALASSRSGVWLVAAGGQILRVDNEGARLVSHVPGLKGVPVTSALADSSGRLWATLGASEVGVLSTKGDFRSYGSQDGLGPGPHFEIYEDAAHVVWLCGADGLTRFKGERFEVVSRANGLPAGGVFGVTEDEQQNLWLATSAGIIRLARSEFDRAAENRTYQMHFRTYDPSDGLAGFPVQAGDRNGIRAGDGTLWFVTSRGLSVVEPRALAVSRPAPRIVLEEITVNDQTLLDPTRALSPDTTKLEIAYTVPELTYPLKTRFRFRLDGFDTDWADAGTRRQATYTNLPPGRYSFRVSVSDDEGRWSETEAAWAFAIAPHFYKTWWFYGLVAMALAAFVWGAWAVRIRQLRRQFSLVLGERVRLSRELHDTLLQSLVGVALEFDAVSKTIDTAPDLARARVVKIRERVEEYIREARRSIWSLRSPTLETGDLVEALRDSATRAVGDLPVAVEFSVAGAPIRCASDIEYQLLRIGQEAVLNAARHAHARTIRMQVSFGADTVALRVADDGRGFDMVQAAERTTDHYGITTMQERAEQVGGRVTITSQPGHGTVVEAVVPVGHPDAEGTAA